MEPDPNLKLATLLDRALAKVDERFADQPRVRRGRCRARWPTRFTASGVIRNPCVSGSGCVNISGKLLVPITLTHFASTHNLAWAMFWTGRTAPLVPFAEHSLELHRKKLGPQHRQTLTAMQFLSWAYWSAGQRAKAIQLTVKQTLALCEQTLGPEHDLTLSTMRTLVSLQFHGTRSGGDCAAERGRTMPGSPGTARPSTLMHMEILANAYWKAGRLTRRWNWETNA